MHRGIISVWSRKDREPEGGGGPPAGSRPLEIVLEPDDIVLAGQEDPGVQGKLPTQVDDP